MYERHQRINYGKNRGKLEKPISNRNNKIHLIDLWEEA
jgi:hypothetical protein